MNKILSNQSWEGVAEMKADVLQEMIMKRYVEAINQVAKKKVRKTGKKKMPVHLRKYIRMKRKAGKELKKKKNLSPEKKIKEIVRKIRLADLGIQNAARLNQEKEERCAYKRIKNESKVFYSYARKISRHRNPIGPFVKNGKIIEEDPATTLNKHYCSVFNKDKEEDKLPEDYVWTLEDLPKNIDWMSNIKFSVKDVQRIIRKISSTSAGPSGISPLLLKRTEKNHGTNNMEVVQNSPGH